MIRIEFKDPGMHPKIVNSLDEAEALAVLNKTANERHYTRAYIHRTDDKRKAGEFWVRALGSSTWQKWDDMSYRERYDWNELGLFLAS